MKTDNSHFINNINSVERTLNAFLQQNVFYNSLLQTAPQLVEICYRYYHTQNAKHSNCSASLIDALSKIDEIIFDIAQLSYSEILSGERECFNAMNKLIKTLGRGVANISNEDIQAQWLKTYVNLYNAVARTALTHEDLVTC